MKKHNIILLITVLLPCVCFAEKPEFVQGIDDIPGIENIRNWDKSDWHNAANHGHPEIQHLLGMKYEIGSGVRQDYKESAKWYLKAVEQGHTGACISIGNMYLNG